MRVGSQFYPDPGKGAGFHVLVLDRNTLEELNKWLVVPSQLPAPTPAPAAP